MFKRLLNALWSLLKEWSILFIIFGIPFWILCFLMCNSVVGDDDPDWWKFWKMWKKDKPEDQKQKKDIDDIEPIVF